MFRSNFNKTDQFGCLCTIAVLLLLLILAVFFPATRHGALVRPIVYIWESSLGTPLPSYNIGPILIKTAFLLVLVGGSCVGGIILAKYIRDKYPEIDVNLQTWGAIASIIGLLVGILSIVLK